MRILEITASVACFALCAASALAQPPAAGPSGAKLRVGVYDSRAVAVAFVNSEVYQATLGKQLSAMAADLDAAKAAGDRKRVAELEAQGVAHQKLLHMQGFSTAPVGNILRLIQDKMPGIAKAAGVGPIVSKWDKDMLARYQSAELVDVTMALVDALHPTQRQRQYAIDIQKQDPVPLQQAEKM